MRIFFSLFGGRRRSDLDTIRLVVEDCAVVYRSPANSRRSVKSKFSIRYILARSAVMAAPLIFGARKKHSTPARCQLHARPEFHVPGSVFKRHRVSLGKFQKDPCSFRTVYESSTENEAQLLIKKYIPTSENICHWIGNPVCISCVNIK